MSASRLSALDATFLELEEADDAAHMHIGGVMVFESEPGSPPSLRRLRAHLEQRLGALPHYRCRLSAPHTGGLRWPSWDPDPDFRIEEHIRHAALPAPGGDAELLDWAGDYWSQRLDRGRPLWDAVLLEALAGGRWALATKTHHALVDGVGSVNAGHLILDTSRRTRSDPRTAEAGGLEDRRSLAGRKAATLAPGRLHDADHLGLGNKVSSLFVHLPVAEDDPRRRYAATLREAEALKAGDQAAGGAGLVALAGLAPPVLHSLVARSLFASRLFNLTITNVPGPQMPLYAFGARLEEVLPLVPLAADHAVGIAVMSYDGRIVFGLAADERAAPDVDVLAAGIEGSLAELGELCGP